MELTQENFDALKKRISILENQLHSNNEYSQIRRLDESQEVSQVGSWSWDIIKGEIKWSDMMFKLLGLEPNEEEPTYELALKHVHNDDKVIYERTLSKAMKNKEKYYLENRIIRKDKTVIDVISRGDCISNEDDDLTRMIGTVQDVTLMKQLVYSNQQLEQFAHILSHDFKAPITTIISFLELVKSHSFDKLTKDGKLHISFIDSAARRLSALVNDILNYSTLNSTKLKISKILIRELLDNVIFDLDVILSEKKGEIKIGYLPEYIYADEIKMRQVFQNIISNAIKFTAADIQPIIKIYCEQKEDQFTFYVSDNGIGISKESSDKIFEPYIRVHNERSFSGTGIGLSICKRIIQMHSGVINCYSKKDKGSTFYFSIPKLIV